MDGCCHGKNPTIYIPYRNTKAVTTLVQPCNKVVKRGGGVVTTLWQGCDNLVSSLYLPWKLFLPCYNLVCPLLINHVTTVTYKVYTSGGSRGGAGGGNCPPPPFFFVAILFSTGGVCSFSHSTYNSSPAWR